MSFRLGFNFLCLLLFSRRQLYELFCVCSRAGFKSSFRVAAAYCFLKMQNAPRQTTLETEKLLFYHWFTDSFAEKCNLDR